MKLWHCKDARSLRPLWTLEEMQLPYELENLPFPPRVLQKSYLGTNPLGTVPYFVDGEVHMTESSAICLYLVERYGEGELALPRHHPEYGDYLNWLFQSDATLTFPQTLVLRYAHFEPAERRQPQVAQDYQRWFLARLRAVEQAVEQRDWLTADRFTAADVAVGYALMLSAHLEMEPQWGPATQAYWQRLQQRPAFQRALQAEQQAARAQAVDETPSPRLR